MLENKVKRIKTVGALDKTHPEYCWSKLVDMALSDRKVRKEAKEDVKDIQHCRTDAIRNGSCWCGKITRSNEKGDGKHA
jgi:hypothetical protein